MSSSSSDDDADDAAARAARRALRRLGAALAALPPRDQQRGALPPAARAGCDVAAAFALCATLHARHRVAGGAPVGAELRRCKALMSMVRARALRPQVDGAAAARHVATALGAQPRRDDAARAAAGPSDVAIRDLLRDARRTAEEASAPPPPPPPPAAVAAPDTSLLAGASFRLAKRLRRR